jgi:hypothetical protein
MPNPVATGLPNPASYDASVAGVVRDNVTGLMWQQVESAQLFTWADALHFCPGLRLAGQSDWRLPTLIELASRLDLTRAYPEPTIDAAAFPNAVAESFWSSTAQAGSTTSAWVVIFERGANRFALMSATHRVRCVR